ncbi:hypothetical protein A8E62_31935 [Burkholderia cenocepacia]|nr:hypothetical protein A8E62_31935 [Burkholderia cenocepacia]ONU71089.1 hypothetical protein A8E63_40930 [Burkholderia cenocepacia]
MKEMGEDVAPVFYKKDPKTFSQVANYFYAIFLKLRDNLKQGNEIELDLDVKIPVNMLKSSAVFSKESATSYITSAFNVATSVFINIDTRDLKAGERLSLVQLTASLIGTVGENCDKLLGMEAKKQVPEKNGEDKKDLKQISEALQNNPNIPDDLKKSLKEITGFFTGETSIAEMQFKGAIESLTGDQMTAKYLETLEGNIFTATFENEQFKEFYPDVNALKAELKNVDRYIEFYAYGIFANTYTDDRDFALTKFSAKLGEADHTEIAAMVFGTAMSAIVQHRAGKESIHHSIFSLVAQFLEYKKKEKAETKAQFAEGFKERGIEVSDSILDMVSNFAEEHGRNKVKEASSEQPKQEVKEAPKSGPASFFADQPRKTEYQLHSNFAKDAEEIANVFLEMAKELINGVRQASTNGDNIENVFKHFCYQHVIRYHLQSVAFAQPGLMESILYYCQGFNRPDLHLVEMVTLAHWRPLLEVAYEELYVPILSEKVKSAEDQERILSSFNKKLPLTGSVKDGSEYFQMSDEEIILNFLEVIPFYQAVFLSMPFTMARNELSPLITEGKDYLLKQSGEYKQTWVTTTLMFAYDTIVDMKKMGRGLDLDQFPNQGPNFALLMLFFFHQINIDMKMGNVNGVPVAKGMEQRYPLEIIPDVEPVKENMMIAMAGSYIFEELVPDLESSKATENKVGEVDQSEGGSGKFSPLARALAETAKEIKNQLQWFQEVEIVGTPFQVVKLAANSLYTEDERDGFDLINGYDKNHKNEEHWKNLGNTAYGKAMFYAGAAIAKVCLRGNEESAIAVLPFFHDVADWIVNTRQENAEELMNFLNVPLSMVYGVSKDGPPKFKDAFGKLIEELKAKGQANDGNTGPSPAVRDLMGNLATLTKGLMGLEGISEEGKQQLAEQLGQLSKMGFSPNEQVVEERYGQAKSVNHQSEEESSGFSPGKAKELMGKMLPWFKTSGVKIDDDVLALSIVINRIIEAEKNGYTDPQETAKKFSTSRIFQELYSTEFGQAVFYATFAIVNTIDKEEFLADMIDGYVNILNWVIHQEERAKKGFYIVFLSGLVEIAARTKNGIEELKEIYDNIMEDFLEKVSAWGKEEGVPPEIMELK